MKVNVITEDRKPVKELKRGKLYCDKQVEFVFIMFRDYVKSEVHEHNAIVLKNPIGVTKIPVGETTRCTTDGGGNGFGNNYFLFEGKIEISN